MIKEILVPWLPEWVREEPGENREYAVAVAAGYVVLSSEPREMVEAAKTAAHGLSDTAALVDGAEFDFEAVYAGLLAFALTDPAYVDRLNAAGRHIPEAGEWAETGREPLKDTPITWEVLVSRANLGAANAAVALRYDADGSDAWRGVKIQLESWIRGLDEIGDALADGVVAALHDAPPPELVERALELWPYPVTLHPWWLRPGAQNYSR